MEAQVVLNCVRGVEDGPTGCDDQDKSIESLQQKFTFRDLGICPFCFVAAILHSIVTVQGDREEILGSQVTDT